MLFFVNRKLVPRTAATAKWSHGRRRLNEYVYAAAAAAAVALVAVAVAAVVAVVVVVGASHQSSLNELDLIKTSRPCAYRQQLTVIPQLFHQPRTTYVCVSVCIIAVMSFLYTFNTRLSTSYVANI